MSTSAVAIAAPALQDLLAEAAALAITFFRDTLKDPAAPLRERRMAAVAILRHAVRWPGSKWHGSPEPCPQSPTTHTPTTHTPAAITSPPAPALKFHPLQSDLSNPPSPSPPPPSPAHPHTPPPPQSRADPLTRALAAFRSTAPTKLAAAAGRADTG